MFPVKAGFWFLFSTVLSSTASPSFFHQQRATPDNTVVVNGVDNYWCVVQLAKRDELTMLQLGFPEVCTKTRW